MSAPRRSKKRRPPEERTEVGGHPADPALETSDQELDEALALTFPASDPPAQTQAIVHVGLKTTNGGPPYGAQR
jgi:hypothetical protein